MDNHEAGSGDPVGQVPAELPERSLREPRPQVPLSSGRSTTRSAARWFPNEEIILTGDSAYGGASILCHLPSYVHLIIHVYPKGALYQSAPPKTEKTRGAARKLGSPSVLAARVDTSCAWGFGSTKRIKN